MAKRFKISLPYMLREVVSEISQNLKLELGVPMNAEIPPSTDEESRGTAMVHFPGMHFVAQIRTGRCHYGQYVEIESVRCRMYFGNDQVAQKWIEELQIFSGPTKWISKDGVIRFELAGKRWARLGMNASNRRNGLPEHRWDDPEHPWIVWARQTGNPSYPDLPE